MKIDGVELPKTRMANPGPAVLRARISRLCHKLCDLGRVSHRAWPQSTELYSAEYNTYFPRLLWQHKVLDPVSLV